MTPDEIFSYPPKLLPSSINLNNYKQVIASVPIFRFIFNSFYVSLAVTIGQIVTSCLAAYAFAYFEFKGLFILIFYQILYYETASITNIKEDLLC